jgi:hypothetical protein
MNRSAKDKVHYENFKKEAKIVEMKSNTSKIKVIKWRGQIFQSKSFVQVFDKIKNTYLIEQ